MLEHQQTMTAWHSLPSLLWPARYLRVRGAMKDLVRTSAPKMFIDMSLEIDHRRNELADTCVISTLQKFVGPVAVTVDDYDAEVLYEYAI